MRVLDNSSIVNVYRVASPEGKIRIILANYSNFISIVNAYECGLADTINEERIYNRRKAMGDLGVRVQSSTMSNPTATEGESFSSIINAVREGDYITALKGADRYEEHKAEILTLRHMRKTYKHVSNQLGCLGDRYKPFMSYIMHETDLAEIAEAEGVTVEAIKQRFRKAKKIVIKGAVHWIDEQMDYFVLEKGA